MKKSLLSAIALTLTFLMLTCAVLTGCSGKEATPSPDQKQSMQSMQSGESVDSKKVEPAPTAEPQPTAETTETYYGFTLDGEARYLAVSMTTLNEHYIELVVDNSELAVRLQEVFEESSFRILNEEESTELSDYFHREIGMAFALYDETGMMLSYIYVPSEYLVNENHDFYGYRLSDDEVLSRRFNAYYVDGNGKTQDSFFEIIDYEGFHQLLCDIADEALAGHTCEEYFELYTNGEPTGILHWRDLDLVNQYDSEIEMHDMRIFER